MSAQVSHFVGDPEGRLSTAVMYNILYVLHAMGHRANDVVEVEELVRDIQK
jgi:hypothetical protein